MSDDTEFNIDVLVVDDERDILELVHELLSDCGLSVAVANSAKEAKKILASHLVRVVLSDIRMPGESGLELMSNVRATHPGVLVFLMTADPGPYYSEIIRSKVDGIFIKPFHVDRFVEQVQSAVSAQRLKEAEAQASLRAIEEQHSKTLSALRASLGL